MRRSRRWTRWLLLHFSSPAWIPTARRQVLASCDWGANDAEALAVELARNVDQGESANIHAILSSEAEVDAVLEAIDGALDELSKMEVGGRAPPLLPVRRPTLRHLQAEVNGHVQVVKAAYAGAAKVVDCEATVERHSRNQACLLSEVASVIEALDFPPELQSVLHGGDLANMVMLQRCIEAIGLLQQRVGVTVGPGIASLTTVSKRATLFTGLLDEFAHRFTQFFFQLLKEMEEQRTVHESRRRRLQPYVPVIHWLRGRDAGEDGITSRFASLCRAYGEVQAASFQSEVADEVARLNKELAELVRGKGVGPGEQLQRRRALDAAVGESLGSVLQGYRAEHRFVVDAFFAPESGGADHGPELHALIGALFGGLDAKLRSIADTAMATDPVCLVSLVRRLEVEGTQAVDEAAHPQMHAWLKTALGHAAEQLKAHARAWVVDIEGAAASSRKKAAIIPAVEAFAVRVAHSEALLGPGPADGRLIFEAAAAEAARAVLINIQRIANESKAKREVLVFENAHRFYDELSKLGFGYLKEFRAEAQALYRHNLHLYVQEVLGQPMELLSRHFAGVEELIAAGTPAAEVGFIVRFSKQELRKCVAKYPGKEVKKNLEAMYKRVARNLSEEENLLPVVWRNIQDEFLKQYTRFEDLIAKCYPESDIALAFAVEELLAYFTTISTDSTG